MNAYEFMSSCPWLTFFLAVIAAEAATRIATWPFRLVNRWIRHRNIVVAGWPPEHLDADGDVVKKETQ